MMKSIIRFLLEQVTSARVKAHFPAEGRGLGGPL